MCRYQDMDKVDVIVKSIRLHIETANGVDQRLPLGAGLMVSTYVLISALDETF